jgi:hypothetical protein
MSVLVFWVVVTKCPKLFVLNKEIVSCSGGWNLTLAVVMDAPF